MDISMDEFNKQRGEEAGGNDVGFRMVYGKNKKGESAGGGADSVSLRKSHGDSVNVEVKEKKEKSKVSFHIPTIKRPQEEYSILVNNANQPFEHVWLQRSEDGERFIHPLVDLEHNQYQSFQGLNCLMQIPTWSKDFVVDTLKLCVNVGPYLRKLLKTL